MANFSGMFNQLANNIKLGSKKYGPQIMIIGGGIGTIAAIVLACVETKKAIQVVDEGKKEIAEVREKPISDGYTEKDQKKDLTKAYLRTGGRLVATYGPAIGVEIVSLGLIGGGAKIINDQKVTLATALAANVSEFKDYRKKLIEKFGDEGKKIDEELRYGLEEVEVSEEVEENGKKKTKKVKKYLVDGDKMTATGYKRILDARNPLWDSHPDTVLYVLRAKQNWFNERLDAFGYVFLNDVLDELGFEKTRVGQEVGWTKTGDGDHYIDFRVVPVQLFKSSFDAEEETKLLTEPRRNCAYMLDFNVDGSIINTADFPDQVGG